MTSPSTRWGPRSSIDRVRDALADRVRNERGDSLQALCPCHDDSTASLSVTYRSGDAQRGGMVLFHCHGCGADAADIAAELGLTLPELFDDEPKKRKSSDAFNRVGRSSAQRTAGRRRSHLGRLPALLSPKTEVPDSGWELVTTYPYSDANGAIVQEVLREEVRDAEGRKFKRFRQRFVDAAGDWTSTKPSDFAPVLYRHSEVVEAVAAGTPVWIMEGEKDVATAVDLGLVATTNAQGAGSFPVDLADVFAGAAVRVVLDRDLGGASRGVTLGKQLRDAGASEVTLLYPATVTAKSDFTDHVDEGLVDEGDSFLGLVEISPERATFDEAKLKAMAAIERVDTAANEAEGHHELLEEAQRAVRDKDRDAAAKRRERWIKEIELRYEKARELTDTVRSRAAALGFDWARSGLEEVDDFLGMVLRRGRDLHELAGLSIPPVLQLPAVEPEPEPEHPSEDHPHTSTGPAPQRREDARQDDASAISPEAEQSTLHGLQVDEPQYQILDGQLVQVIYSDGEPKVKSVLSLDARLVSVEVEESIDEADTSLDDLLDPETREALAQLQPASRPQVVSYTIGYHDPDSGEFLTVPIPERDYRDCTWLETLPGPPKFDSRSSGRARVIDALKGAGQRACGGQIPLIVRHRVTGWRQNDDGESFYIHAAGAINARGFTAVPVEFSGALRNYALPRPSDDAGELRTFARDATLSLMDILPDRVAAPILGQIFRSVLGPTPTVVTMAGLPGSYKTSIASLAMHHLGLGWDRNRTGASMSGQGDTGNALRIKLNACKDSLLWADDVAPGKDGNWSAAQERLQEFARMVYNGEARSRATRDGQSLLDGTPPRASAMVTSEVTPQAGSSGGQRMLLVPLRRDEVVLDDLISHSTTTLHRQRAVLMASFIQWLAADLQTRRDLCARLSGEYSDEARRSGVADRPAEALGNVWAGWALLAEFLTDIDALTQEESDQVLSRVLVALDEAWEASRDPDQPTNLGAQVRDLLSYALSSRLAYVSDVRGGMSPSWPLAAQLGWAKSTRDPDHDQYEPGRNFLGWVLAEPGLHEGEPQLLLDPAAFEAVLKAASSTMTSGITVDRSSALRALCEEGTLIPENRTGTTPRFTVQRKIHCEHRRKRVVALRLWDVIDNTDDDNGFGIDGPDITDPDGDGGAAAQWPTFAELLGGASVRTAPIDQTQTENTTNDPQREDVAQVSAGTNAEAQTAAESVPTIKALPSPVTAPPKTPDNQDAAASESVPAPQRRPRAQIDEFRAAVAVLDVDGVHLPDGTIEALPAPCTHLGHLAQLAYDLNLGVKTSPKTMEAGQIWVTSAALKELFNLSFPDFTDDDLDDTQKALARRSEQTVGSQFVTGAQADGWTIGGSKDGDRVSRWTRVWREDDSRKAPTIVLIPFFPEDPATWPMLVEGRSPREIAAPLERFARALKFPYKISAQTTGLDLAKTTRMKDRREAFAPHDPCPPAQDRLTEDDFHWVRVPTDSEAAMTYVHAYDRGGSYAGAIAGLELGIGEPEHVQAPEFDRRLPGYWRVKKAGFDHWGIPHPLNFVGEADLSIEKWVSTPSLELAIDLGFEPEISEGWLWPHHARVLDAWYSRVRDARASLDTNDQFDQEARDLLKTVYTRMIGSFTADMWKGRPGYAPERRHAIIAKSRANMLRRVVQIGRDSNVWPLAVETDTVLYASNDPDPVSAWPGNPKNYGRGFGQLRWEGSALMSEHKTWLDPNLEPMKRGKYLGKHELVRDLGQLGG